MDGMSQAEQKKPIGAEGEGAAREGASPEVAAASAPPAVESEVEALRRELAELKDKNLRLLAETQNQQKRFAREKSEALRYAEGDFARDLLVVLDDFDRTLESARTAPDAKAVADGVKIVYDHFVKILQQRGVTAIEAAGQPFDPHLHEAMLQQPSTEHAAGVVIQELARGWKMHDRVLRPARVAVSSGPAKSEASPDVSSEKSGAAR